MTIAREVVYALHQRIKDLVADSPPDKIAYLAKALESIAGQSTVFDIVQMTDVKLKELLDNTTNHLKELDTSKTNALEAISELEQKSLKKIGDESVANLSLLDTRKDSNIAAINSVGDEQLSTLKGLVSNFKAINDVPSSSSIMKEIKPRAMLEARSLPFLFGVLNRSNDYNFGHGYFTSDLGQWYKDTTKTDHMLSLLAGTHSYDTSYVGFYRPPSIYNLQGNKGTFIYREFYLRGAYSTNIYQYPYALLGVIFVKNTTEISITRTLNFVFSSHWSSGYEGAGVFVGTPDNSDTNKEKISTITWTNIYSYSSSNTSSDSGSVDIPAGKTVAILLYSTPLYHQMISNYYVQFMQWGIYNFRSHFLTTGLEVDIERTLRAWQCPGLSYTYELWH